MSRKRKNAGEGYGYMISGAFNKKADAKRKEKTRKGSFVKPVMFKTGLRYAVLTPRKNPPKRKNVVRMRVFHDPGIGKFTATTYHEKFGNVYASGFTKKEAAKNLRDRLRKYRQGDAIESHRGYANPEQNPSELLVMGANPSNRELTVPAGSTITIRMNPTNPADRYTTVHAEASGARYHAPALIQTKRQKRVAEMVRGARKRGGRILERFAEEFGHDVRSRGLNPSAAAIREGFTGMPAEFITVQNEPHVPAGDYAQLGELLALHIKPAAGGQVQTINYSVSDERPTVISDESARQLYFVGGNQDVSQSLHVFGARQRGSGVFELGEARRIDYKQRKEHVRHPEQDSWRHSFGEETGVRPIVLFDDVNKRILLEGGEYEVRPEGITN